MKNQKNFRGGQTFGGRGASVALPLTKGEGQVKNWKLIEQNKNPSSVKIPNKTQFLG